MVKVSGEALMGPDAFGLHPPTVTRIAADLADARALGVELAVVVGGGNIFRGVQGAAKGLDRATADQLGMLATVMNALALEAAIEAAGTPARTMSAVAMPTVCEPYSRQKALSHLAKGRVVLLAGGTGNPFFTTDTGGALRAAELGCGALLKATNVDGVYSSDPKADPAAVRYERLTHSEAIDRQLGVMDAAAFALARESRMPIIVFSIQEPGAVTAVLRGEGRATLVTA
ncbi:Uridylate kinase [Blastochloris viridis]|uniref:Uridylate kinase n=1 Tax=Blastochloris viridis TaxID=1079 RepID=A0A0S4Q4I7_BLAVI|nr:Uridylate kinase [Blastochloris viridis]